MFDPIWTQRPFIPIATDRLLLRPMRMSDAETIAVKLNDIRVSQTLGRVPFPYALEDAETFIASSIQDFKSAKTLILSILDRQTNEVLGACSIEDELGIWLAHDSWGKGYGFEAMQALVHFGFSCFNLSKIKSAALESNMGSVKIHRKLGFRETGTQELTSRATGKAGTALCFELTREEYFDALYSQKVPVLWVVAAALVNDQGELLMAQRPEGKALAGVWELPGGKIEPDENPEEALARELKEELGIDVDRQDLEPMTFATYHYTTFHLLMPLYLCQKWKGQPYGAEGQNVRWVRYDDLSDIATPAADVSLFHRLADFMKANKVW